MENHIPPQHTGKKMDIEDSVEFENETLAKNFFEIARQRVLDINNWHEIAKVSLSTFEHLNVQGLHSYNDPQKGDFVKIDISAPGLQSTGGFDYVKIDQITASSSKDQQQITITLRPSTKPGESAAEETKHFFENLSTSTLQVKRTANVVAANYYGRNELINLAADSIMDKLRNFLVALGAKMGASYPQWKALITGILKTD